MDKVTEVLSRAHAALATKVEVSQWKIALVTVVVGSLAWSVYDTTYKFFNMPKETEPDCPVKGDAEAASKVVDCYVFPGGSTAISTSPFSVKFITYLRLAGIPHNLILSNPQVAPKGKTPYISHDGKIVSDSELILRYIENTFDVASMAKGAAKALKFPFPATFVPFAALSAQEQAVSDLVRLSVEGELYWALVSTRWFGECGLSKTAANWTNTVNTYFTAIPAPMRTLITEMIRVKVYHNARGQGLTRHSAADQIHLASRALRAISTTLGTKKFLLGDDRLCEGDCALFGSLTCHLDDSRWVAPLAAFIRAECPNLVAYEQRIRSAVFFDEASKHANGVMPNFDSGVKAVAKK